MPAAQLEVAPLTKGARKVLEEWAAEEGIEPEELLSEIVRDAFRRIAAIRSSEASSAANVVPFGPKG